MKLRALEFTPPQNNHEQESDVKQKAGKIIESLYENYDALDFNKVSVEERDILVEYLKANSDNLYNRIRTELLEQSIMFDLIDDNEACLIVDKLDEASMVAIGEYLAKVVDANNYLLTFHKCVNESSLEYRINELLPEFNYDTALLLAPYQKDLFMRKHKNDSTGLSESLYEMYFKDFERMKKLTEVLIFTKEKDLLSQVNKAFLIANIRKLKDENLYTDDEIKELFERNDLDEIIYLDAEKFYTEDDEKIKDDIYEKVKDQYSHIYSPQALFHTDPSEIKPLGLKLTFSDLRDRVDRRASEYLIENFHEYEEFIDDKLEVVSGFLEGGFSIFDNIEKLNLTEEEIKIILNKCSQVDAMPFLMNDFSDFKKLFIYVKNNFGTSDKVEKAVVQFFVNLIHENGYYSSTNSHLVANLKVVREYLSEKSQETLLKYLNNEPNLWLYNLGEVYEGNVIESDEFIDSFDNDSNLFVTHYHNFIYHINKLDKEKRPEHLDKLNKKVKQILEANPDYFFHEGIMKIAKIVYNDENIENVIVKYLNKNTKGSFFVSFLQSEYYEKYKKEYHKIIIQRKEILINFLDSHDFSDLCEKMDVELVLDLVEVNMGHFELEEVIDDTFMIRLSKNRKYIDRFLNLINDVNYLSDYPESLRIINRLLKQYGVIEKRKKEIENLKATYNKTKRHDRREELSKLIKDLAEKEESDDDWLELHEEFLNIENLKYIKTNIENRILKFCEEKEGAVFSKNITSVQSLDLERYINRDIDEYVKLNPNVLVEQTREFGIDENRGYHRLKYGKIVEKEKLLQLFKKHLNRIAFARDEYYGYIYQEKELPEDMSNILKAINPFINIYNQEKLDKDFHIEMIDAVKDNKYFELYKEQLEKIKNNQIEYLGEQYYPNRVNTQEEFTNIIHRIALFENSDLVLNQLDAIKQLSVKEQDEIAKLLEFSIKSGVDDELDIDISIDGFDITKEKILDKIKNYLVRLFELDVNEIKDIKLLNIYAIEALGIYYQKTCKNLVAMKKSFQSFVKAVIGGNYSNWREWGVNGEISESDIDLKFSEMVDSGFLPQKLTEDQYAKWRNDNEIDTEELLDYDPKSIQKSIGKIFEQSIIDDHIDEELIFYNKAELEEEYKNLIEPLNALLKRKKSLQERFKDVKKKKKQGEEFRPISEEENFEYDEIQLEIEDYREEIAEDLNRIKAQQILSSFKKITINDIELKQLRQQNGKMIPLSKAFSFLNEGFINDYPEFRADIRRIQSVLEEANEQMFGGDTMSKSKLRVTDKVDLPIYTMIGEKPVATCQNYNSEASYNKGLLSYLTDPNVKIIQVYNEKDKIIARSVMRLMENKEGKPEIFIERIYSASSHQKIYEVVKNFAEQKAGKMGVNFFNKNPEGRLYSKGSRSPYVYSDSGGGLIQRGEFTI